MIVVMMTTLRFLEEDMASIGKQQLFHIICYISAITALFAVTILSHNELVNAIMIEKVSYASTSNSKDPTCTGLLVCSYI